MCHCMAKRLQAASHSKPHWCPFPDHEPLPRTVCTFWSSHRGWFVISGAEGQLISPLTMSKLFKEPSCSTHNSLRVKLTTTGQNKEVLIVFLKCTEGREGAWGRGGASPPGCLQVLTPRRGILDYSSNHCRVRDLNNRQGGVTAVCAFLQLKII